MISNLRYFATVARHGSIREAAEELNVAQSALSRQIQKLEQDFGVPLFQRHARGVELTSAGEIFLRHARVLSIRHDGQDSIPVATNSFGHRVRNLLIRPIAQAGLFVRSQVRAVHGAEGNGKRSASRLLRPLRIAVASTTPRDGENVLAFGNQLFVVRLSVCCDGK